MNSSTSATILDYQAIKLQEIINTIVDCCNDRKTYENQKFGIPYAEIKCLLMFRGERYLTVKTLAERLDVAKSRVTKIIKGLISKGLVEKIEDPRDNRVKLLSITSKGKKKISEIELFQLDIHRRLISHIKPEDRANLFFYLEKLIESMQMVREELV